MRDSALLLNGFVLHTCDMRMLGQVRGPLSQTCCGPHGHVNRATLLGSLPGQQGH